MLTKVAAVELGPHGIAVNCIAPGSIETERTRAEAPELRPRLVQDHAAAPYRHPAGRRRRRLLPGRR